jgi:hypothetical protein
MRCSTIERTEITNALCRHFGDGRLDEEEFNERTAKATAAKTRRELAPLLADLPPLDGASPTPRAATQPRRHIPPLLVAVVAIILLASALPFTFMAWHAHWILIGAVALFLLFRHDRRARTRHDGDKLSR